MRRQNAGLLILLLVACVTGCTPRITLLNAKCSRLEKDGRLESVRFHCNLETQHLRNTQIVYQVTLFNKDGYAVRSSDGKYDVKGQVGATRTFMILSDRQTFDGVSVTIPKDQLEFGAKNIPAVAKFAIFLPDGKCLAEEFCTLPAIRASEVMPPLVLPKAEYWFAKRLARSPLPLLIMIGIKGIIVPGI